MAFVTYILQCSDGSFYTGHTDNLEQRLNQHQTGDIAGCYTVKRRPVVLKWCQEFSTREEAFQAERQIKGWSRRKKQALIDQDWEALSLVARSRCD